MAQALDQETIAWVKAEVRKLAERGVIPGSPRETDLLKHWKENCPSLYHRLQEANLAVEMALVLGRKRYESQEEYIQAGWPPTDAEEQATKEWLMMDPEETEPRRPHPTLSVPIST